MEFNSTFKGLKLLKENTGIEHYYEETLNRLLSWGH